MLAISGMGTKSEGDGGDGTVRVRAPPDARRAPRRLVSVPARIAFRGAKYECALLDVSPFGARVRLRTSVNLPGLVALLLPGGEWRVLLRVWQNGRHVGLESVGTAPLAFAPAADGRTSDA